MQEGDVLCSGIGSYNYSENYTTDGGELLQLLCRQQFATVLDNGNSNTTGHTHHPTAYSTAESIIIGIILCLIIFSAIAGNILVCIAIFQDRHLRKNSNYLLVSLAIADLLVATMVMTFAVANDIIGYWVFDPHFCNVWISFDILSSTSSILNLCAISFDRYLHIKNPMVYDRKMNTKKILLCIVIVWVLSALISFIPIHLGWHMIGAEPKETTPGSPMHCFLDLNPTYALVSSSISFYLPCIIMVCIYGRLYSFARQHVANIRRTTTFEGFSSENTNGKPGGKGSYKVSDHKAAVTLGVIMGVFLLCWVPFFIINIVQAFCKCVSPVVFSLITWVGYVNSMLNPIIYSIFNSEFRNAFRRILHLNCKPKTQYSAIRHLKLLRGKSDTTSLKSDKLDTTTLPTEETYIKVDIPGKVRENGNSSAIYVHNANNNHTHVSTTLPPDCMDEHEHMVTAL